MESVLLIALILAVIFIIKNLSGKINELHTRFDNLDREILEIRSEINTTRTAASSMRTPTPKPLIIAPTLPDTVTPIPEVKPQEVAEPISVAAFTPPVVPANPATETYREKSLNQDPVAKITTPKPQPLPAASTPNLLERFLKNNPDLEKFIGENLMNKIGIAILVLGIGYFVKFAIDQEWINEIGRVFIGILAGGLLIGVAHRLRHTLAAFSSVLVGGGLAVLYFTIAIAFHEYQLFSQTAAFLIMVVITGFSIALSVSYNRVELAVLAILGGFSTPFMLSTGEGNYLVLFIYILILNTGMLVLAYLKGWKIINWIAYVFTVILYGGWLYSRVLAVPNAPYIGALVFASLFYLIFFLMNIISNIKEKTRFTPSDITILLSNTFLFYSAGMVILYNMQLNQYQGLFTVALALFNFGFAFALFQNQQADRNLIYLLVGLVITFVSLAIPVQLEGNYITMFWALEAVLLLWLAQKSELKFVVLSSVIVLGLMLISLIIDWTSIYLGFTATNVTLPVLLNKGFITSFISLLGLAATLKLLQNQIGQVTFRLLTINFSFYRQLVSVILTVVLYLALFLELQYQLNTYVSLLVNRIIITGAYNVAFVVGLLLWTRYKQKPGQTTFVTGLAIFTVLGYMLVFSPSVLRLLRVYFLDEEKTNLIGFAFHYLSLALVLTILYFIYQNLNRITHTQPLIPKITLWALCGALVFLASSELLFHVIFFNSPVVDAPHLNAAATRATAYEQFEALIRQTYKVGFPILWGVCAFAFMFMGLQKKNKTLRIIALSLFSLTLLKLFIYDIRGISEGGKIAAFISLGVLLLVISFMYQNIKRIILADEATKPKEE